jgi:NAD(P)-dependent dehydrogenase (short-subunit alcohol dehydrogenase family)
MDLKLKGKRVVITGASKGIGLAIARSFAREGAAVFMAARNAERLEAAAATIKNETGAQVATLALDAAASDAGTRLLKFAGNIDVLVNNAGAIPGGDLAKIDEARWREAWELKLFGYINITRQVLPAMAARKQGVIANIIGMAGVASRFEYICGATANAGLIAFTNATGGASTRDGVRVFGINPSATRSDRIMTMMQQTAEQKFGDASRWMELTTGLPFGRMAEPEEISELTVFCSSPLAGYLSGTVINVDGGQMFATPR